MIYLDSCIVFYLVEQHPAYAPSIEATLVEGETYTNDDRLKVVAGTLAVNVLTRAT